VFILHEPEKMCEQSLLLQKPRRLVTFYLLIISIRDSLRSKGRGEAL